VSGIRLSEIDSGRKQEESLLIVIITFLPDTIAKENNYPQPPPDPLQLPSAQDVFLPLREDLFLF